MMRSERGQTIPVLLAAIVFCTILSFALNMIGSVLSLQIRAQSAADSAAAAVVGLQAQQWNQMSVMLYANDVEEYRIRNLLESMRLAVQDEGGCAAAGQCATVFSRLNSAYLKSLTRYDTNAQVLSRITTSTRFQNLWSDGQTLLGILKAQCNGNTSPSLDCQYAYSMPSFGFTTRSHTGNANFYPQVLELPSDSGDTGQTTAYQEFYGPLAVEVAVCKKVSLFGAGMKPFDKIFPMTIIARGAATNVLIAQEWVEPGTDKNPITNSVYQPTETYGPKNTDGNNWYQVDFGGNTYQAQPNSYSPFAGLVTPLVTKNEMSVRLGWWGAVPIHVFSGSHAETDFFPGGCPT